MAAPIRVIRNLNLDHLHGASSDQDDLHFILSYDHPRQWHDEWRVGRRERTVVPAAGAIHNGMNVPFQFDEMVAPAGLCAGFLFRARDSNGTPPADRNRSHGEIPGGGLADQTQLQQRLLQALTGRRIQDLVRKNKADPRFLQTLQSDPKRQEEIEKLLRSLIENHPGLPVRWDRNDPMVRQLESLYKDWGGNEGTRPPGFDHDLWKKMENTAKVPNTTGSTGGSRIRTPRSQAPINHRRQCSASRPAASVESNGRILLRHHKAMESTNE